jgi:transaldolase
MSIHPKIQKLLIELEGPFSEGYEKEVPADVISRLMTVREFVKAYELDGMLPEKFITFGVVQKTLAQFTEYWNRIGSFPI